MFILYHNDNVATACFLNTRPVTEGTPFLP